MSSCRTETCFDARVLLVEVDYEWSWGVMDRLPFRSALQQMCALYELVSHEEVADPKMAEAQNKRRFRFCDLIVVFLTDPDMLVERVFQISQLLATGHRVLAIGHPKRNVGAFMENLSVSGYSFSSVSTMAEVLAAIRAQLLKIQDEHAVLFPNRLVATAA